MRDSLPRGQENWGSSCRLVLKDNEFCVVLFRCVVTQGVEVTDRFEIAVVASVDNVIGHAEITIHTTI